MEICNATITPILDNPKISLNLCINIIPRFSRKIKFLHTQTYKLELWFEVAARKTQYRKMCPLSKMVPGGGLEPPTNRVWTGPSTNWGTQAYKCRFLALPQISTPCPYPRAYSYMACRPTNTSALCRLCSEHRKTSWGLYYYHVAPVLVGTSVYSLPMLATAPCTSASTPVNGSGASASPWKANPLVSSV